MGYEHMVVESFLNGTPEPVVQSSYDASWASTTESTLDYNFGYLWAELNNGTALETLDEMTLNTAASALSDAEELEGMTGGAMMTLNGNHMALSAAITAALDYLANSMTYAEYNDSWAGTPTPKHPANQTFADFFGALHGNGGANPGIPVEMLQEHLPQLDWAEANFDIGNTEPLNANHATYRSYLDAILNPVASNVTVGADDGNSIPVDIVVEVTGIGTQFPQETTVIVDGSAVFASGGPNVAIPGGNPVSAYIPIGSTQSWTIMDEYGDGEFSVVFLDPLGAPIPSATQTVTAADGTTPKSFTLSFGFSVFLINGPHVITGPIEGCNSMLFDHFKRAPPNK